MATRRTIGRVTLGAVALAGMLLLAACSQDVDPDAGDLVADAQAQDYAAQAAAQHQVKQANDALPERPVGTLAIDGTTTFSLTPDEVDRYNATGSATEITLGKNTQDQAFQELCAGKIDLVDSERRITRSEWEACQAVGLDVVQFQIASDGIVVAIKSESDVGGDCLSTDQVQETWRAGSPITNWSQLGLDDVPVAVGGPSQSSFPVGFETFGKTVLGSPAPGPTDLRSDYFSYDRFGQARTFLNGGARNARIAQTYADSARQLGLRKSELVSSRQVRIDAHNELDKATAERAKGIRDKRSPAAQAKDEARVVAARAAVTKADEAARKARVGFDRAKARAARAATARRTVERSTGHVVYARFSSYELFEEELRPFEITTPDGHRNCVFPSQTTIASGDYPLSTQVLITTTTRSLKRKEVTGFLKDYLESAQEAATAAAMIGLTDRAVAEELQWLDGVHRPVLVVPAEDEPATDPEAIDTPAAPAR
ncbi:substrate-binding domain-containing protein [Nocardioides sp. URHA0020]|uniref:substrate-binding domain-containing protein n=1 Tax=Nocardioides sp. URHA0020 TaxID=1380392 RepID=UPI00048D5016|nr:substrate-binding domain-containing protein [Nocardioides sp. URHA0020]